MKNDTLEATISLDCFTCRTRAYKDKILLRSESTGHFHCAQCGYEVLEVIFQFEKTNIGIHIQKRPAWKEEYDKPIVIDSNKNLVTSFKSRTGETIITINGNQ